MTEPAGILFIGDPHLASRRPGRRRDPDFAATSLGKLERALAIADERDLLPVILGDLFDRAREDDHALLIRTVRLLRSARRRPWCLVGNHDRVHARLTDETALALVREAGAVRTIEASGPCGVLSIAGTRVGLGGTPHGQAIPDDVSGAFEGAEVVLWLTHHDLAFGPVYPGVQPIHPVRGCHLVVNGHMHRAQEPVRQAGTMWFNPGNILRQSVDLADQEPAVWSWHPARWDRMERHPLPFERDVFDLTGRIADPIAAGRARARESLFVELLKAESRAEAARTDEGSILLEEIERLFEAEDVPADVRAAVLDLHRQVTGREPAGEG